MTTLTGVRTAIYTDGGRDYVIERRDYTLRDSFNATGTDVARFQGRPFVLLAVLDEASETLDEEVVPMFKVEIDGEVVEAFVEEVTTAC